MSEARNWFEAENKRPHLSLERFELAKSLTWFMDEHSIRRHDNYFFSVVGIEVLHASRPSVTYHQPLINQPEIGILGFILSMGSHGKHILVQGKPEPGNTPVFQLAPAVQATVSNYERRHGGSPTPHLGYFREPKPDSILSDTLQSEQGTRFLGKYNRNMTVVLPESERPDACATTRWLRLDEMLDMLGDDYVINTDARSVLATTPWSFLACHGQPFYRNRHSSALGPLLQHSYSQPDVAEKGRIESHLDFLQRHRWSLNFQVRQVPLTTLSNWHITDTGLQHVSHPLTVQHVQVHAPARETHIWDQPLFSSEVLGTCVLLCQCQNDQLNFLFTARYEPGFREGSQFGPTLQSEDPGTERLHDHVNVEEMPIEEAQAQSKLLMCCHQSDEGGRFYRCITRYEIRMLQDGASCGPMPNSRWMTLGEIERLLKIQGVFTNEARTLISMLLVHV